MTYFKRKRGLLKKCIELSIISGQDIFLVMRDKKYNRLVEFNSTPDFNLKAVTKSLRKENLDTLQFRKYFNTDLELLEKNMTPAQFESIETTHIRMLRLQLEAPEEEVSVGEASESEYYER